jgi:hypothetical protein
MDLPWRTLEIKILCEQLELETLSKGDEVRYV